MFFCADGTAQLVLATVGQAFELRYKMYLNSSQSSITPPQACTPPSIDQLGFAIAFSDHIFIAVSNSVVVHNDRFLLYHLQGLMIIPIFLFIQQVPKAQILKLLLQLFQNI